MVTCTPVDFGRPVFPHGRGPVAVFEGSKVRPGGGPCRHRFAGEAAEESGIVQRRSRVVRACGDARRGASRRVETFEGAVIHTPHVSTWKRPQASKWRYDWMLWIEDLK